jgi:hypothetical protein
VLAMMASMKTLATRQAEFALVPVVDFLEALFGKQLEQKRARSAALLSDRNEVFLKAISATRDFIANKTVCLQLGKVLEVMLKGEEEFIPALQTLSLLAGPELEACLLFVQHFSADSRGFQQILQSQSSIQGLSRKTMAVIASVSLRLSQQMQSLASAFDVVRRRLKSDHAVSAWCLATWKAGCALVRAPHLKPEERQRIASHYGDMRISSFAEVLEAAETQEALAAWASLKKRLKHGYIRLYQFVKTYAKISPALLQEFFLKGAGVVCRTNEHTVDAVVPVAFLKAGTPLSNARVGTLNLQFKDQEQWVSESEKNTWKKDVAKFAAESSNIMHPFLGVFLEIGADQGNREGKDVSMHSVKKQSLKRSSDDSLVSRAGKNEGFVIFSRGLRPTDIDDRLGNADVGLNNLLRSARDAIKTQAVPDSASAMGLLRRSVFYKSPGQV